MILEFDGMRFDHVTYDAVGDVLYLREGPSRPAARTHGSPEGHAIRHDADGRVIGLTVVNARWLLEEDGRLIVTLPPPVEIPASALSGVLGLDRASR